VRFVPACCLLALVVGCTATPPVVISPSETRARDVQLAAQAQARPSVDVDWNRRGAGEGSNAATDKAIADRCKNMPQTWRCSDYSPDAVVSRNADQLAAQVTADQLIAVRAKRDADKKLMAKEVALIAQGDQADATARLAAQTAQAQAIIQQAQYAMQRQAEEIAYQQRLAACTAAADLVALSIRSFWGGIAAGLATGTACMN
jgi:hypothetical protein